jgi:hypothetical protein
MRFASNSLNLLFFNKLFQDNGSEQRKLLVLVVDSSIGSALSFSHEGLQFKSWHGLLLVWLLICDQIDC